MSHACHRFWKCYKTLTLCLLLRRCTIPCACHAKPHLNLQKWHEHYEHVVHFDFEMCFAPQRRALFQHLNFQKWSEHGVFCTFRLRNLLRATTACTFSTSQLPTVVRTCGAVCILTSKCASRHNGMHFFDVATSKNGPNPWCVLYILTSKCASRHNGVHFFDIATSNSGPTMVCFVHFDLEMCFAPQRRALFRHRNFQQWPQTLYNALSWLEVGQCQSSREKGQGRQKEPTKCGLI